MSPTRTRTRQQPRRSRAPVVAAAVLAVVLAAAALIWAATTGDDGPPGQPADIEGIVLSEHPGGRHTSGPVDYPQRPPVGGPHDPVWADCAGAVYDIAIRAENAVHSLEHGAVWITYDPQQADDGDVAELAALVQGRPGLMLSPHPDLDAPISLQAWGHQLTLDTATDPRLGQFVDLLVFNPDTSPEPGGPCDNPAFLTTPRPADR